MRAFANAKIVFAAPDHIIVTTVAIWRGEIGNLVSLQSDRIKELRRLAEAVERRVVGRRRQTLAGFDPVTENRPLLKLQGVGGAVGEPPSPQPPEPRAWVAGVADDEVDAGVFEPPPDARESALRRVGGVAAAHVRERRVVQRLDAHRNAVDAVVGKHGEELVRDVERMKLHRHLGVRRDKRRERGKHGTEAADRRRAAAEVDGPEAGGRTGQKCGQRISHPPRILRARRVGSSAARVEGAVRALPAAEREVQVEVAWSFSQS